MFKITVELQNITDMAQVKCSLDQLQYICNELKDENEIAIIERYGYYTRCYTIKMICKTTVLYIINNT